MNKKNKYPPQLYGCRKELNVKGPKETVLKVGKERKPC